MTSSTRYMPGNTPQDSARPDLFGGHTVEVRIHGVSGTPPEDLLERHATELVAGDRISGFYQPGHLQEARDPLREDGENPGPHLEGYSWGAWTSRARTRAFWLILAPFAFVNVAARMAPPGRRWTRGFTGATFRMVGLLLTITMVFGAANVSLIPLALRCSATGGNICEGLSAWWPLPPDWMGLFWRFLAAALIPIIVVLVLWAVGYSSANRYAPGKKRLDGVWPGRAAGIDPDGGCVPPAAESAQPAKRTAPPKRNPVKLSSQDLWKPRPILRALHVQAGFVTVWLLAAQVLAAQDLTGRMLPQNGWYWWAVAPSLLLLAFLAAAVCWEPLADVLAKHRSLGWRAARWFVTLLPAVPLMFLAWTTLNPISTPQEVTDIGNDAVTVLSNIWRGLFVSQIVMVLGIAGACWTPRAERQPRMFLAGMLSPIIAALGVLVGAALTNAVIAEVTVGLKTDQWLPTPVAVAQQLDQSPQWFGNSVQTAGIATLFALLVLIAISAWVLGRWGWVSWRGSSDPGIVTAIRQDYGLDSHVFQGSRLFGTYPDRRYKAISRIFWQARLLDQVPKYLAIFVGAMGVFFVFQAVALLQNNWHADNRILQILRGDVVTANAIGLVCTVYVAVAIVLVGVLAYRTPMVRRLVGILWDVTCFWPRHTHPFAPPCYNEKILPQMAERVTKHVPLGSNNRAVLAGHSQGSVIAFTSVLQEPKEVDGMTNPRLHALRLITVGCVLDRLYAPCFPDYFNEDAYADVLDRLGQNGWINIWRNSDFVGGAVPYPLAEDANEEREGLMSEQNRQSVDPDKPRIKEPHPAGERCPQECEHRDKIIAKAHSDFWADPVFKSALALVLAK